MLFLFCSLLLFLFLFFLLFFQQGGAWCPIEPILSRNVAVDNGKSIPVARYMRSVLNWAMTIVDKYKQMQKIGTVREQLDLLSIDRCVVYMENDDDLETEDDEDEFHEVEEDDEESDDKYDDDDDDYCTEEEESDEDEEEEEENDQQEKEQKQNQEQEQEQQQQQPKQEESKLHEEIQTDLKKDDDKEVIHYSVDLDFHSLLDCINIPCPVLSKKNLDAVASNVAKGFKLRP